jgi:hypothetical protein
VGPRPGVDGCGKFLRHRDTIPGPSSLYRITVPTALSQLTAKHVVELTLIIFCTRKARESCLLPRHEGVWGSGGMVQRILSHRH